MVARILSLPPTPPHPRVVVWLGCLCCFCGYLGLYLLASGRAPGRYTELILFALCAGKRGAPRGAALLALPAGAQASLDGAARARGPAADAACCQQHTARMLAP